MIVRNADPRSGYHGLAAAIALYLLAPATSVDAAELAVADLTMPAGTTANLVVTGAVIAEPTFGVSVLLEIVPRAGTRGTVVFTPPPPADIVQLGDPWPGVGMFSPFESDSTFSDRLNGCVDDNETFIPETVAFLGDLASFPVFATANAGGVWDVVLSTSAGDSSWEGLFTTLEAGTIAVTPAPRIPTASTWGLVAMTLLVLSAGTVVIMRRRVGTCQERI